MVTSTSTNSTSNIATNTHRQIGADLDNPRTRLMSKSRTDHALMRRYFCSCPPDQCPLLTAGRCLSRNLLGSCLYARITVERGFTPRARDFGEQMRTWLQEEQQFPRLDIADYALTYIGDLRPWS